jgi:serine/threonine protein kinase
MNDHPSSEEQLLKAALQFATWEAQIAYLKDACADDPALRQRVEAQLPVPGNSKNSADPDLTIKSSALPATPRTEPLTERDGDRIGPYKLLQEIGEGGMGSVWMAEQEKPVRRRVALKIVKLGMDTKQVVARFEAERQALAIMDHPNIAKVLDAGSTETGRPFFVMELVRGVPITEYCDQARLSTKERLELLIQVCRAIQHAHQKGIIHRDIKPSNVLVTLHDGVPVPKVIDFGIAKAIDQPLTEKTLFTRFEQFMGTPAYMSPEQAEMSGLDIDTRTDIYSLGVLLYELLTGQTPFIGDELVKLGVEAMRRTIRDVEPPRPSTRLSTMPSADLTTTAQRRQVDPVKLISLLRGDLDWVVMKCLEKDRKRRYETANGLGIDLQRYLDNEPVMARPPSTLYRFQKFLRRNKLAVAASGGVALALVLGVIGTTLGLVRAEKQRRAAEYAQRLAQQNFDRARAAVDDLLAVTDDDLYGLPGMQPLRVKLMRVAIDRYQPILDQSSADPALRAALGRLYLEYGFVARDIGEGYTNIVIPAFNTALTIQRQLVKEYSENRSFRADLGWTMIYSYLWHDPSGFKTYQPQAIAVFEGLVREDPADPFARSGLAWALGLGEWTWPDTPEKRAMSDRRLGLLELLVKEYPLSAEFRRDLANQLGFYPGLGEVDSDYGAMLARLSRANELREGSLAVLERRDAAALEPLHPRDSEARILRPTIVYAKFDLANGWRHQSLVLTRLKRWPDAISIANRATAMARDLAEENPSVEQFSGLLNQCFLDREQVAGESGDKSGAVAYRLEADKFWRAHPSIEKTDVFWKSSKDK